uniref:Uncharacterized protein n=1 Tax=Romanomermis culicivorax TaxID=13658 RepID=A0A915JSA2_ROMCU
MQISRISTAHGTVYVCCNKATSDDERLKHDPMSFSHGDLVVFIFPHFSATKTVLSSRRFTDHNSILGRTTILEESNQEFRFFDHQEFQLKLKMF